MEEGELVISSTQKLAMTELLAAKLVGLLIVDVRLEPVREGPAGALAPVLTLDDGSELRFRFYALSGGGWGVMLEEPSP